MTKSLPVSKRMVYDSYLKVCSKQGGAGIDKETIEIFDKNLSNNLYQVWNRMSSGSYFPPPVRTVLIPKKQGGKRPLGIPTVKDRIAQGVVKDHIEPQIDAGFHPWSYGYRPGKSAHQAVKQCHENCRKYEWVIDVDIKGFFDNINHEIMMQLLSIHTQEKWVLMYVERWLKAGVEQEDGSIVARGKGTPQGGVVSPLLSNIYLNHCFDQWMDKVNKTCPFERYADDIVIHCKTQAQAKELLESLKERMREFDLELHPDKTKIVYCKDYRRNKQHEHESFTFLGFSFQPRSTRSMIEGYFVTFRPAISNSAKKHIRNRAREIINVKNTNVPIEYFAKKINNRIMGWINYYGKFEKNEMRGVFKYINDLLRRWIRNKYKIRGIWRAIDFLKEIQTQQPELYYHWKLGMRN